MKASLGAPHRPVHLNSRRCFAPIKGRKYFWVIGKPTRTWSNGPWVARIDLQGLAAAPALGVRIPGQVDVTPFVTFLKTQ